MKIKNREKLNQYYCKKINKIILKKDNIKKC